MALLQLPQPLVGLLDAEAEAAQCGHRRSDQADVLVQAVRHTPQWRGLAAYLGAHLVLRLGSLGGDPFQLLQLAVVFLRASCGALHLLLHPSLHGQQLLVGRPGEVLQHPLGLLDALVVFVELRL